MKIYLLSILLILNSFISSAQNGNTRIVFYWPDMPKSHSTALWAKGLLMRGDTEIARMKQQSVMVYDAAPVSGTYRLAAEGGKNAKNKAGLSIYPRERSIIFIKLETEPDTPARSRAEITEFAEFAEYYQDNKWLRKKIAEAGFESVAQLASWYEQDSKETIMRIRPRKYFRHMAEAEQTDTAYLDAYKKITSPDSAFFFGVIRKGKGALYEVRIYDIDSNRLAETGQYSDIDSLKKEGIFLKYYKSGVLLSKGEYHNDKETGSWESYYDTSVQMTAYRCNYVDGHREGELSTYYLNGVLKRKEVHHYLGELSIGNRYQGDTVLTGKCYDKTGKEIAFTPYEVYPLPAYDMNRYLQENLKYPNKARKKNIQGRVVIKFIVDEDGSIKGVQAIKHVSPEIDAEAMRVVANMPKWQPGIQDDKPVAVYFTLPLVFKLE